MRVFNEQTLDMLRNAGWSEHRYVPLYDFIKNSPILFPLARSILIQFDGLQIGTSGAGVDCAASDIKFDSWPVYDSASEMEELCAANGKLFCPLGYCHCDHGLVVIDEEGKVFTFYDSLRLMGSSFEEGIQNILDGRSPR
ncbi:hypothetical protein VT03_31000 [Planctomyces sp. SH-PL14]|nr:hypothetical protein VT03_31000 [Planctomyces sp. SH-PL14]